MTLTKQTVTFDDQKIDVHYHYEKQTPNSPPHIEFDNITYAGTDRHFDVDMSRWDEVKEKLHDN